MKKSLAISMSSVFLAAVLTGCMTERPSTIPTNATLRSSGNDSITFTPLTGGTVWIYDANNDKIVYSGVVTANQAVVVDPQKNQVTVNGRIVAEKVLNTGANNRIFFLSDRNAPPGM